MTTWWRYYTRAVWGTEVVFKSRQPDHTPSPRATRPGQTWAVRKQYHFWPGERGLDAWDVDRLIELSRDLPVREVPVDSITEVDTDYWFFDRPGKPTVRQVIEHLQLIEAVDPSYPIILGPDGRVMDGMHRVARALLDERATILAVQFEELPEPDYRNCRSDELPY